MPTVDDLLPLYFVGCDANPFIPLTFIFVWSENPLQPIFLVVMRLL